MKFCILRSGSSGNCTYIEHDTTRLLLDAGGKSQRGIHALLDEIGLTPDQLDGIIVTHLHSDHLNKSTLAICDKYSVPLWIHEQNVRVIGTIHSADLISRVQIHQFDSEAFSVGEISFTPFEVSHDAFKVTSGFRFFPTGSPESATCYAADLGHFPNVLVHYFRNVRYIILESNHDTSLLWENPNRPYVHKKRVTGEFGHLSNEQTADALRRIAEATEFLPLKTILCHLSGDHNSPELALETVGSSLYKEGISMNLITASRFQKSELFVV